MTSKAGLPKPISDFPLTITKRAAPFGAALFLFKRLIRQSIGGTEVGGTSPSISWTSTEPRPTWLRLRL